MQFAHPEILWLSAITIPVLAAFLWWTWRKKQQLIRQFVQDRLLEQLSVGVSIGAQKLRLVLLVAGAAFIFLAIARPQWGYTWEEATQRGRDIMVAIDTSRSMLAQDVTPNRLTRAQLAAYDLAAIAEGDRLGLIAFAGTAFVQCPLTQDDHAFRQSLDILSTDLIPQGGSALAEAIQAAIDAFDQSEGLHKVLILITDGEDHESGAVEAAQKAAAQGIRIFTIGVGTPNGELLRQKSENGEWTYIKDAEGNVVKSRLNELLLTQIATSANGFYLPLSGANTMEVLYARGLAPLPEAELASQMVQRFHERYQWPLAVGILLLISELLVRDRKRGRTPTGSPAVSGARQRAAAAIILLFLIIPARAASPQTALQQYENGRYASARHEYEKLLEAKPNDPQLHYNAGVAAYRADDFAGAAVHLNQALLSQDELLQQRAFYNLGNTLFRLGETASEPQEKTKIWRQALAHYEAAMKIDPKDADAQFNFEFVQQQLKNLEEQQPQEQRDSQSEENKQEENKPEDSPSNEQQQQQKDQQEGADEKKESEQQQQSQDNSDKTEQAPENKPGSDEAKEEQKPSEPGDQKEGEGQQEKKEPAEEGDAKPGDKESGKESASDSQGTEGESVPGTMTLEQVQQLLNAHKQREKTMIFVPERKAKSNERTIKNW